MKQRLPGTSVALALALVLALVATTHAGDTDPRLASMGWLEGRWTGPAPSDESGTWEAIYSGPEGGTILSLNKEIVGGRAVTIEFEQFMVQGEEVVMIPAPGGRRSDVHFTLEELDRDERRAVFTNPAHDFPQLITYHRSEDDTLTIDVQARREGELYGFRLTLKRDGAPVEE